MDNDTKRDEEQTRPAQAGETDTTRFGLSETDAALSPGGLGGGGSGLSSGLQLGGIAPGGGPAAMVGSLGTGGGSNANQATGDAKENTIDEDVK